MSKAVITQPAFDGAHFSIAEMFLANVKKMMCNQCEIESYAINTQYRIRETLVLSFPGEVRLQIQVEKPK